MFNAILSQRLLVIRDCGHNSAANIEKKFSFEKRIGEIVDGLNKFIGNWKGRTLNTYFKIIKKELPPDKGQLLCVCLKRIVEMIYY